MDEIKHALRSLGQSQKITRILAQSLLKTIKNQDRVKFFTSLIEIILKQQISKEESNLIDISAKLLMRNIDYQFIDDPKILDYVGQNLIQSIQGYLERAKDLHTYDLQQVISLIGLLVRKFSLKYEDILDTNSNAPLNLKQRLLVQNLIVNEVLTMENDYMYLKKAIMNLEEDEALDIFIEVTRVTDDVISIIDLFNSVFKKNQAITQSLVEKYELLSAIEPFLFLEQFEFLVFNMPHIEFNTETFLFKYLKTIRNVLIMAHIKISKECIKIILQHCHELIIIQLESDSNQSLIDDSTINFLIELIQRLDFSQNEPRACQQPLITIVQNAIINDIDLQQRQSGILMLQLLARYLNTQSIQEIYPLIMMVIQISQFFQSSQVDVSSLHVIKYILNLSDSHLFEIYGDELINFFKNHFISDNQTVKQESYQCLIVLLREGDDSEVNQRQSYQEAVEMISLQIVKILKSNLDNCEWVLNGIATVLRVLNNEALVNEVCKLILDLNFKSIPSLFVQIAVYKNLELETIAKFTNFIKIKMTKKQILPEILKSFLFILKNKLFEQHLSPQKIINVALKFMNDQYLVLKPIDLNFDLSSDLEVRFNNSLDILRISLKLMIHIFNSKSQMRNIGVNDKDIQSLIGIIKLVQDQPHNYKSIIIILSKFMPKIFNILDTKEQEEVLRFYFITGLTSGQITIDDKVLMIKMLLEVIQGADHDQLQKSLLGDILRFSQILINHLNQSLKNEFEGLNLHLMKVVFALTKHQSYITISLQNVIYNEYVPKTLKNNQKLPSYKVSSLKFLLKIIKYSNEASEKILNSAFEAFQNFMGDKSYPQIRFIAIKALYFMIRLPQLQKLPKDIKKILDNIQQLIIDNQKQIEDPVIYKTQNLCLNIVNVVLRQVLNDQYEGSEINFESMRTLINFWIIHIINLERKNHNNFEFIETFTQILMTNQHVILGKNNQNLSGTLKILSLSLTEYCFESNVERMIAQMLLKIQTEKPMMFVMATSVLDLNEKQFINKLVETQAEEYNDDDDQQS